MRTLRPAPLWQAVTLLIAISGAGPAQAQLEIFPGLGGNSTLGDEQRIAVRAVLVAPTGTQPAKLVVTADLAPGWNTYSITQPDGGQIRTQIRVAGTPQFQVGAFQSIEKPVIHLEPAFNNLAAEEHRGSVTWVAAVGIAPGVDLATLEIRGSVYCQLCKNGCIPPQDYEFAARLGSTDKPLPNLALVAAPAAAPPVSSSPPVPSSVPPAPGSIASALGLPGLVPPPPGGADLAAVSIGSYEPKGSHLKWNGRLEPAAVAPGGKARLFFTAEMAPKWHVYAVEPPQSAGNQATLFVLDRIGGFTASAPQADRAATPPHGTSAFPGARMLSYFENRVTWAIEIDVPAATPPGEYPLGGAVAFQTCDEKTQCDRPQAVRFETTLLVGPTTSAVAQPIRFIDDPNTTYFALAEPLLNPVPPTSTGPTTGYDIAQIQIQSSGAASPLPVMLGLGLLAGFILNFMPCVLPVIGLKVLSFVEQGGHDRKRVFLLNVWYSLGILIVFLILATIPVAVRITSGTQFGWGQQFSYDGFNITLVAVVFVMALSFLGVWEIPIPGFAGGGGAQKAASKEGAVGAIVKGMITTVLATPCSGPFLGTAVAFAFGSSAPVTYAMFTAMGLGMAAPYLLIGLRPELVKFLPKPGEWMDTFKQLMGFVLIGTVLWLMLPIDAALLMPTLVLLAGLAAACWWIGRTPGYAELPQKIKAWGQGVAFAGFVGWLAFAMPQVTDPLPWKHFAMADFVRDVNAGKTVLVEFTADWCATCKTLKAANLDRSKTKARVAANDVVVYEMNIDKTSPEGRAFFEKMQPAKSVPLVAIFPAGKKYEPIHFGDGYTQGQILDALDAAGPSQKGGEVAERAGTTPDVH